MIYIEMIYKEDDMLEYIILGFLMRRKISGYDLKQYMAKSTAYFFDASFGSIYPALKRLTQKNSVSFHEIVEGGKYKKIYEIMPEGRAAFMKWIAEPIVFEKSRQDHLVKIFFYEFLPKEEAVENLKHLMRQVEPVAEKLIKKENQLELEGNVYPMYYQYASLQYGIRYYRLLMDWCGELIRSLEDDMRTDRHMHGRIPEEIEQETCCDSILCKGEHK